MSREIKQMFCVECDKKIKVEREIKDVNHILHLLLTVVLGIVTRGVGFIGGIIWLILWLLMSIKIGTPPFHCNECGSTKLNFPTKFERFTHEVKTISKVLILFGCVFYLLSNLSKKDEVVIKKDIVVQEVKKENIKPIEEKK